MSSLELTFSGQDAMVAKLLALAEEQPQKIEGALRLEAERVMTAAKRLVPVDDGALRASGFVNPVEKVAGGYEARFGFGGPAAPYALAIHEHLSVHSPPSWKTAERDGHGVHFHPSGTGPKYLENTLKDASAGMADRLAERLKL